MNRLLSRLHRPALAAVAVAAAATALLPLDAAAQSRKVKFAADWAFQGPQAIFLMPHENGCYQKAGLDVTTDRGFGSGDTVTKVAAGAYDVGFADINTMAEFNARNPQAKLTSVFMIYDATASSIVSRKGNGIAKPADLVGKNLAAPPGDASRRLFSVLAKANGFDASSVKWTNVSPEMRETMLARKSADGISGASFTAYMGVRAAGVPADEVVMLRFSEYGAPLYGSALVVKPAWAAANAETLTALIGCISEGITATMKNPGAAIDALMKRDALADRKIEMERMMLSIDWSIATPWVRQNGLSSIDPKRLAKSMEDVAAAFEIPVPPVNEVYTDKYLPAKAKLMLPK
jgi:NitT/TauT family transport system substrate-binding protein